MKSIHAIHTNFMDKNGYNLRWIVGEEIERGSVFVKEIRETTHLTSRDGFPVYVVEYTDGRLYEIPYHSVLFVQGK